MKDYLSKLLEKRPINLRKAGYSYLIIGESFKLSCNTLNEGFFDGANTLKSWISAAFSGAGDTAKEYAYDLDTRVYLEYLTETSKKL